jgi:pentatricopeptide repeat protein
MQPDKEFFGMLIEALTHRGDIPQALKLLEEMTALDIKVKDYHLRKLRARCQSLGVTHPDMPEDPLQWVKDVKRIKALHEPASQRRIQPVQSALYTKT